MSQIRTRLIFENGYQMLTINLAIQAITGEKPHGNDRVIRDAAIDSRLSTPESLFIALPGEVVNGHAFVGEAFAGGAIVALIDQELPGEFFTIDLRNGKKPGEQLEIGKSPTCILVDDSLKAMQKIARFWRRQLDVEVIGITGSVGKSTTKEVIAEVLSRRFRTLKSPGNLNNEIGLPLTLLKLNNEHERAVLEMGFYVSGEIDFLCDLALPKVGVVTNVGTVHAERAGTIDDIARGKAELVKSLPPGPDGLADPQFR